MIVGLLLRECAESMVALLGWQHRHQSTSAVLAFHVGGSPRKAEVGDRKASSSVPCMCGKLMGIQYTPLP
eukprot:1160911-Pelagomonas_calceolata.AAC.16